MITINSLLFTCEHPKTIITRDNRKMVVSCGKCRSCLADKQRIKSQPCSQQEKISKYCFFVTLTYDRYHVPCMYPVFCRDAATGRQYIELYDEDTGELLGNPSYSHSLCRKLMDRTDDKKLHYARYSDVQKFYKRVRRKIEYSNKYNNEKIKYYSVSEYGPRTFRPHFHILFYFDSPKLASDFGQIVDKAWPLGYTYTTLSKGFVSCYVASYVNSITNLPEIFKSNATDAKSSHSSFLGMPIHEKKFAEVFKYEPKRFVRSVESKKSDGTVSSSAPWRSYKAYAFPKCYGYSIKDFYCRVATYNGLQTLYRRYGQGTASYYAEKVISDYYNNSLTDNIKIALLTPDMSFGGDYVLPTHDILISRIYQLKHFYNLCKKFDVTPLQLTRIVDEFYSSLDYQNLIEMYGTIQESEHILPPAEYELFSKLYCYGEQLTDSDTIQFNGMLLDADLVKKWYFSSSVFSSLQNSRIQTYITSVKHKELNDLNNIFMQNNEQLNVIKVD